MISPILSHPWNAPLPIFLMFSPTITFLMLLCPLKALSATSVTGMLAPPTVTTAWIVRLPSLSGVPATTVTLFPSLPLRSGTTVTVRLSPLPTNTSVSGVVTLTFSFSTTALSKLPSAIAGGTEPLNSISVILGHPVNAPAAISVTLAGILTDTTCVFSKAPLPMTVTPSGSVTSVASLGTETSVISDLPLSSFLVLVTATTGSSFTSALFCAVIPDTTATLMSSRPAKTSEGTEVIPSGIVTSPFSSASGRVTMVTCLLSP